MKSVRLICAATAVCFPVNDSRMSSIIGGCVLLVIPQSLWRVCIIEHVLLSLTGEVSCCMSMCTCTLSRMADRPWLDCFDLLGFEPQCAESAWATEMNLGVSYKQQANWSLMYVNLSVYEFGCAWSMCNSRCSLVGYDHNTRAYLMHCWYRMSLRCQGMGCWCGLMHHPAARDTINHRPDWRQLGFGSCRF